MKRWIEPTKAPAPSKFIKLVLLAFAAAAGAALMASLMAHISESRFRRKMTACADSFQSALPTLRRAAEITIAEHEPAASEDTMAQNTK